MTIANPGAAVLIVSPDGMRAAEVDENGNLCIKLAVQGVTLNVDDINGVALTASEAHIGAVGGHVIRATASFTRPADTTAYAPGDLVANNTVANSVTPMTFNLSRATGKGGMIRRARLRKSTTGLTGASFRLHLYALSPTQTGGAGAGTGDNAAWLTDRAAYYVGAIDITCDKAFTDGASGNGVPNTGSEINFTADTYYGLLEARGAYAPGSAEVMTVELEVLQN